MSRWNDRDNDEQTRRREFESSRAMHACGVTPAETPSDDQLMAIWQKHARMGPAMIGELCGFAREVLATYGVQEDERG